MLILCNLKGALGHGISYKNHGHTIIECFSNTNWAGWEDRRSTSGYCVFVEGNVVSWKSKKQNVVSRFNAESDYIMWKHQLLLEVGIETSAPTKL